MKSSAAIYWAVAKSSFRRYSTYRAATLAGIFTNCVFGVILCFVYRAVWDASPHAGGYDSTDAVTYVWLGQAMIMTVAIWGGGSPDDLAQRVKSGDVVVDLYRPVSVVAWYLSADLGRSAFHLLTRGLAPTVVGALVFGIHRPEGWAWLWFTLAVPLAVVVSFGLRMIAALATFWTLDDTGPRQLQAFLALFFSGLTVPLVLFPDALRHVALALPWASFVQLPADLWLGQRTGTAALGALGLMLLWAVLMLGIVVALVRRAERRVVVQGG